MHTQMELSRAQKWWEVFAFSSSFTPEMDKSPWISPSVSFFFLVLLEANSKLILISIIKKRERRRGEAKRCGKTWHVFLFSLSFRELSMNQPEPLGLCVTSLMKFDAAAAICQRKSASDPFIFANESPLPWRSHSLYPPSSSSFFFFFYCYSTQVKHKKIIS